MFCHYAQLSKEENDALAAIKQKAYEEKVKKKKEMERETAKQEKLRRLAEMRKRTTKSEL